MDLERLKYVGWTQPKRYQKVFVVQWCALENQQSPFCVLNEVILTGQNPSLKFFEPLELSTKLKKDLDL